MKTCAAGWHTAFKTNGDGYERRQGVSDCHGLCVRKLNTPSQNKWFKQSQVSALQAAEMFLPLICIGTKVLQPARKYILFSVTPLRYRWTEIWFIPFSRLSLAYTKPAASTTA